MEFIYDDTIDDNINIYILICFGYFNFGDNKLRCKINISGWLTKPLFYDFTDDLMEGIMLYRLRILVVYKRKMHSFKFRNISETEINEIKFYIYRDGNKKLNMTL